MTRALWPAGVTQLAAGRPCRYCAAVAWLTDTAGPMHTCCHANASRFTAGLGCPACFASQKSANRDFEITAVDRRAIRSGKRRSAPQRRRRD